MHDSSSLVLMTVLHLVWRVNAMPAVSLSRSQMSDNFYLLQFKPIHQIIHGAKVKESELCVFRNIACAQKVDNSQANVID